VLRAQGPDTTFKRGLQRLHRCHRKKKHCAAAGKRGWLGHEQTAMQRCWRGPSIDPPAASVRVGPWRPTLPCGAAWGVPALTAP